MIDWLDEFNVPQREAVTYGNGPILVIAGAGTGKTKTLAGRAAHLVQRGVDPHRILLLTFARRAAAELLRRARRMSGRAEAEQIWGGTFHATANRLLRLYGRAVGLSPEFTVMDQSDAADLLNLIRDELGLAETEQRSPRKDTLIAIYSRTVNAQQPLREVVQRHFPWCTDHVAAIAQLFDAYTNRKQAIQVLDFDDLLVYWLGLLEQPDVGRQVADRFDHILVDEYQDTNAIQAEILRNMRRNCRNIMVVGDDAQAIYSFRAATVRNILDFPQQFPGTHVVKLEQNYRSTQPILAASNAVMAEAKERYEKDLWSERHSAQAPLLLTCCDEAEQTDAVCRQILEHREQGIPLREQAVLFRTGHHSAQLEIELARRNIPFHKFGGLQFVEAAHIKDLLGILRILENPRDELSWFRTLQLMDGVGPKIARRIMGALGVGSGTAGVSVNGRNGSPLARLDTARASVPRSAREIFGHFVALAADCAISTVANDDGAPASEITRGPTIATQIERARRFYEPLCQQRYDDWRTRLRDLERLEEIAARYRSRRQFLADLTLDPPTSTSDLAGPPVLDDDYLILSTIHSAKGLEWDTVHVIHASDGCIPSDMALTDEAELEEERRLFYVALTRARDWLYVCFPLRYYRRPTGNGDAHHYAQLTRFLAGAVQQHFEKRALTSAAPLDPVAPVLSGHVGDRLRRLWVV